LQSHTADTAVLEEAVQIMQEAGSIDYARNFALNLIGDAKESLEAVLEPNRATKLLLSMADFFISRSK